MTDTVALNTPDNPISADTPVSGAIALREQSGSTHTITFLTTVGRLGVVVSPGGTPVVATQAEVNEAMAYDQEHGTFGSSSGSWARLGARIMALNNDSTRNVGVRIREAVANFLQNGGVPDFPIDNSKYTWTDRGANALNLTGLHDDDRGSITGVPGAYYLALSGSAVWGKAQ